MTDDQVDIPPTMARVLIVDDSPTALRLLQAVFEGEHYDVVTAKDGLEGLGKVHQCKPDVVVADGVMPGMDGFAFLRKLRDNPATRSVPVIILTAEDPRHSPHRNTKPQPDAFLMKSADLEPLLREVRAVLARGDETAKQKVQY